jgi:CRP-like cAMP-binding protein
MRGKKNKADLLAKVDLFAGCSKTELGKIASLADEVEVPEGYVLTREGKPGAEFFVIADGRAKVTLRGRKLNELGLGVFFGEMALLEREPRAATITALTPMKLYVLSSSQFVRFLADAPTAAIKIMRGLAHRLRQLEKAPKY